MVARRSSGPNTVFVTLVVFLRLATILATQTEDDIPHYKLKFGVYYNSSGIDDVTKNCGAYYAKTFLGKFIAKNSTAWMMEECRLRGAGEGVHIQIQNRASVKLYNSQVEVSVDIVLNVDGGSQSDLRTCGSAINTSLQRPETVSGFDHGQTFIDSLRNLDGKESDNCSAAIMSPPNFFFQEYTWICDTNYSLSSLNLTCVQNGAQEDVTSNLPTSESVTSSAVEGRVVTLDNDLTLEPVTSRQKYVLQDQTTAVAQVVTGIVDPTLESVTSPHQTVTSSQQSLTSAVQDIEVTPPSSLHQSWGVKMLRTPPSLRLEEGAPAVNLDLQLWADKHVLCQGVDTAHCHVTFNVSIADGDYTSPLCRKSREIMPQVVFGRPSKGHATGTPFCSLVLPLNATRDDPMLTTISLRAVSDNKYDGTQRRQLALSMTVTKHTEVFIDTFHRIPITIVDQDRKATCQSINDPHITTFDGLEYNNYYEGEFVLYRHTELPATVHVVYQRCGSSVQASCNCAVAVQSGDDVLVIDRCFRKKRRLPRISGQAREINPMRIQLYLNGDLTPGTRIYQEADGKKYYVYLPHGTYVKVLVNGLLVNVWIVASPADLNKTKGLCGAYDKDKLRDMTFPNGTVYHDNSIEIGSRGQPVPMMLSWRVDMGSHDSLLQGVDKLRIPYEPPQYCQCQENTKEPRCGYSTHVDNCDVIQGVDVTDMLVRKAVKFKSSRRKRLARDVEDGSNSVIRRDDPILVNKDFVPPEHKWKDNSHWNEATSKDYCTDYILNNYTLGQICAEIVPSVNFKQEISTCQEDIQITKNTSWAMSARDAMKEQCLEEIQKNGSLSDQVADQIQNAMCINDCNSHGDCVHGTCHCAGGFTSSDCSISEHVPPYAGEIPRYGLCDIRTMNCSRVIVYGDNFVNSDTLMCYFQECEVNDRTYVPLGGDPIGTKATFIDFQAVECPVPKIKPYLIRISNNNGLAKSDPLLFLPFDPNCRTCNIFNTTCTKVRNSCIIDEMCYSEGESSPNDECLICEPVNNELQWTTQDGMKCQTPWWNNFKLPSWAVAVPAAIGGSIVGVLAGFLLYKCCCKNYKKRNPGSADRTVHSTQEDSPFEDAILHRNRGLPVFSSDRFGEIDLPQPEQPDFEESYFYNDGRGVENGVDSSTYF